MAYGNNTPNISQVAMQVVHPSSGQPMEKCAPDVGKWATSRRYAGVRGIMWCMKCNGDGAGTTRRSYRNSEY